MRYTQQINFELSGGCPFQHAHPFCPAKIRAEQQGWPRQIMWPHDIINAIFDLRAKHDFTGYVGFHFYSDPMSERAKMCDIVRIVKGTQPKQRFLLWTNAANFIRPHPDMDNLFDLIMLSLYDDQTKNQKLKAFANAQEICNTVKLHAQDDDGRIDPKGPMPEKGQICLRPFFEMTFDHAGDLRLCCHDWRGETVIGNLVADGLATCVAKWQETRKLLFCDENAGTEMHQLAPKRCVTCRYRYGFAGWDPEIADLAQKYALSVTNPPQSRT